MKKRLWLNVPSFSDYICTFNLKFNLIEYDIYNFYYRTGPKKSLTGRHLTPSSYDYKWNQVLYQIL